MKKLLRKIVGVALLLLLPMGASAQGASVADTTLSVAERNALQGFNDSIDRLADDFIEAYIVIADPSPQLYSVLGHCALHLKCGTFDLDYVYSYESEDATQKVLSFLAGHLKMGLFAVPIDTYCQLYQEEGRGVRQYRLNLSPVEKQELWRILDKEVARGADLDYDYYHRGCANSCVRFVKKALRGKRIHYAPWEREYVTGRELGREHTREALWMRFWICFIAGNEIDKPLYKEAQLIMPEDLVSAWQKATIDGHPLLAQEPEILVESTNQKSQGWFTPLVFALIVLILCIANLFWNKPFFDWAMLSIQTLLGVLMTYLLFISDLCCTDWNWLYIVFNPLPAIFWYWRKYWVLPYCGAQLIWCVAMMYMILTGQVLVDWSHIILALAFCVVLAKQSPLLQPLHSKK